MSAITRLFSKKTDMAATAEEAAKQATAPYPTLLQHKFANLKITQFDIHPVKPWILFAEKDSKKGHIFLYDYEQHDVLHSFAVHTLFEQRKEEMQLLRILEKNYNGITLPDWYISELLLLQQNSNANANIDTAALTAANAAEAEKALKNAGELKGIRLYDEDVVHWKLNYDRERDTSSQQQQQATQDQQGGIKRQESQVKTMQRVGRRLSFSAQTAPQLEKKERFVASRAPRCIVLHLEYRIVMLRYDEVSSSLFVFDEVKHTQLDNKTITCMEFLYSHPLIAVGGTYALEFG